MATKPNANDSNYNIPTSWSDTNIKTRPSADKITLGWLHKEKPPYQYFNWFWNFVCKWLKWTETSIDDLENIQRKKVFQIAHGFLNHFVYYDKNTSLWTKAIATSTSSLATHFAVRIDDDNFYAYNLGELPTTGILDESNAALTKDTYYYLSDSVAGKCTSVKPTTNEEQICFKVNDTYLTLFPSYCPGLFTKFSKLNGDSSENFSVADGIVDTHAVNLGQLNAKFPYVPYSVNYGNTDANGYADLIEKISDTEVAFKVGGDYPNMGVTFPNGKHYEISEIPNVSGLDSDGLYKFCIFESNLVELENGTYGAIVIAVKIGYTGNFTTPVMQSDSEQGFDVFVRASSGGLVSEGSVYKLFDHNNSTGISLRRGTVTDHVIIKKTDDSAFTVTDFLWYSQKPGTGTFHARGGTLYGSNNSTNGNDGTWTTLASNSNNVKQNLSNPTAYKMYKFFPDISLFGGYSQGSCIYNEIRVWYNQDFAGGTITEGYTAPAEREDGDLHCYTNQRPLKPVMYIDGQEIETQFVKLGESIKLDGEMGTPITYAFNARTVIKQNVTRNANYSFNHYLGYAAENILYDGYFHNISGTEDAASIPNGSSGYKIGVGAENQNTDMSDIRRVNSLSLMLYTGSSWLYQGANSLQADFADAQAVIHVWRAF